MNCLTATDFFLDFSNKYNPLKLFPKGSGPRSFNNLCPEDFAWLNPEHQTF